LAGGQAVDFAPLTGRSPSSSPPDNGSIFARGLTNDCRWPLVMKNRRFSAELGFGPVVSL
jgi:hypothetical protein